MSNYGHKILMSTHDDYSLYLELTVGFDRHSYLCINVEHTDYDDRDASCTVSYRLNPKETNLLARRCRVQPQELPELLARKFPRYKENQYDIHDFEQVDDTLDDILDFLDQKGIQYVRYKILPPQTLVKAENDSGQSASVEAYLGIGLDLFIKCNVKDENSLHDTGELLITIDKDGCYRLCEHLKTSITRLAQYLCRNYGKPADADVEMVDVEYSLDSIRHLLKSLDIDYAVRRYTAA